MPAPDSVKKTVDGEAIEFRTRLHKVRVFKQAYLTPDSKVQYARNWVLKKSVNKVAGAFRLGYDMRTAEKRADEISAFLSIPGHTIAMAIEKYSPGSAIRGLASIGECLEKFGAAREFIGRRGRPVSKQSYRMYRLNFLRVLRTVTAFRDNTPMDNFQAGGADYSPWLKLSTDVLDARLVNDYKLATVAAVEKRDGDEEELLSAKISADSQLQCARALFSARALKHYADQGLKLPDLQAFMKEPNFGARKYFELLHPDVITQIMRDSLELRALDPQAYKAFLLCMHCGLRHGEAAAFQSDWLRIEDTPILCVRIRGEFNPKGGKGRRTIVEPWVAEELAKGGVTDAEAFERLTEWVKARIPTEARVYKPLHELRKCWCSMKAKVEGILATSQQAGHADMNVTKTHYADNLMPDRLLPFWQGNPDAKSA